MDKNIFFEYLTKFFLSFGQEYIYLIIIILGFNIFRRQLLTQTICVLFFAMILNVLLKYTFKIPLNPALNIKGFAFPSGHMTSAVVFYGWFFTNIRYSLLQIIIIIILTGFGFSAVYRGYHYPVDIIGSITIGMIIIAFVYSLTKEQIIQKYPFVLGVILWLLTVPITIYLSIIKVNGLNWLWTVFLGLLGFAASWGLFYKYFDLPQSKLNRFFNLFILIISIALIKYGEYLFKQYFG